MNFLGKNLSLLVAILAWLPLLSGCLSPGSSETRSGVVAARPSLESGGNGSGYGITRELRVVSNESVEFPASEDKQVSDLSLLTAPEQGSVTILGDDRLRYEPKKDFEGLDEFAYKYKSGTAEYDVKILVDVGPCHRVPARFPQAKNMHVLASSVGYKYGGNSRAREVLVVVKPSDEPVTLVLLSGQVDRWRIQLQSGAVLGKVFLMNLVPGLNVPVEAQISGVPAGVPVERSQLQAWASGWESIHSTLGGNFPRMIHDVRRTAEHTEASFQGCAVGKRFEIPYSVASIRGSCVVAPAGSPNAGPDAPETPASHYNFLTQNCNEKCGIGESRLGQSKLVLARAPAVPEDLKILADELGVGFLHGGGAVRSSLGRSCGKYYYEVRTRQGTAQIERVGVAPLGSTQNPLGTAAGGAWATKLNSNEVIGFALDLDEGLIYISRNGRFAEGVDPEAGIGGVELGVEAFEPMYPFIFTRGGKTDYNVNFGGNLAKTPFVYQPPEGFLPGY